MSTINHAKRNLYCENINKYFENGRKKSIINERELSPVISQAEDMNPVCSRLAHAHVMNH